MKFFQRIKEKISQWFAPSHFKCVGCGKELFDQVGFCQDCLKQVVFNNGKTCPRCGVGIDGAETYCGNCAYDKVYFDKAYSAFSYEGMVKKAILDMKFHNMACNAKVLARYLVFLSQKHNLQFDIVCYAPMTASAKRKRRYNQAQMLAMYFCDMLGRDDALVDAIEKSHDTTPQEKLNKQQRKKNLVGAYKLRANVKGKRVLVIDDIKTTGSTLNECAKVLKRGGAISVVCLTVASRKENYSYENADELY